MKKPYSLYTPEEIQDRENQIRAQETTDAVRTLHIRYLFRDGSPDALGAIARLLSGAGKDRALEMRGAILSNMSPKDLQGIPEELKRRVCDGLAGCLQDQLWSNRDLATRRLVGLRDMTMGVQYFPDLLAAAADEPEVGQQLRLQILAAYLGQVMVMPRVVPVFREAMGKSGIIASEQDIPYTMMRDAISEKKTKAWFVALVTAITTEKVEARQRQLTVPAKTKRRATPGL